MKIGLHPANTISQQVFYVVRYIEKEYGASEYHGDSERPDDHINEKIAQIRNLKREDKHDSSDDYNKRGTSLKRLHGKFHPNKNRFDRIINNNRTGCGNGGA